MEFNLFGIRIRLNKEYVIFGAVIVVVVTGFAVYRYFSGKSDLDIKTSVNADGRASIGINASGALDDTEKDKEEIQVYVVGCVNTPGVVTLEKGQIILDAIEAAGGATEDADIENINLAYKLNSNVMIRIRSVDDEGPGEGSNEAGTGVEIIRDSGGALADTVPGRGRININRASVYELQVLPGIGEVTAGDIVDYRDKHGPFENIEDIMKVRGIKEGRFESIRDLIAVD